MSLVPAYALPTPSETGRVKSCARILGWDKEMRPSEKDPELVSVLELKDLARRLLPGESDYQAQDVLQASPAGGVRAALRGDTGAGHSRCDIHSDKCFCESSASAAQGRLAPKKRQALGIVTAAVIITMLVAFSAAAYMVLSYQSANSSTTAASSASSSVVTTLSSSQGAETTKAGPGTTVETTDSTLGLKLTLSVNSTTIPSQEAIGISASVVNTRTTANNLTASDDWAAQGLSEGACNYGNATNKLFFPIGLDIFRGNYGKDNLSSAGQPIDWWPLVECPVDGVTVGTQYLPLENITSYSLFPGNDSGTYAGYYLASTTSPPPVCSGGVCTYSANITRTYAKGVFPMRMAFEQTINAANGTGFYSSLGSSLPAKYTLVAGDEWGQLTLLHFSVVASNSLPKVGSFLANGGGCAENNNPAPCTTSEFSQAFIFNCASQAATPSGCTTQVPSSGPWGSSYTITVRYPYTGQPGEPATDNCMFSVPGVTGSPYAYCFMVNATSFALSP